MATTNKGMPELSNGAWFAALVALLSTLALGVYPFIAYPVVLKRFLQPQGVAAIMVHPWLIGGAAALTAALLALAMTGDKPQAKRSTLAYAACAVATIGVVTLVAGLKILSPR